MYTQSVRALTGPSPLFYGRIGGSDTDMMIDYLEGMMASDTSEQLLQRVLPHRGRLAEYNGYYDKSNVGDNLLRFCEVMLKCYQSFEHTSLVGEKWQTLYFKNNLNPKFHVNLRGKSDVYQHLLDIISAGSRNIYVYPFAFIEKTTRDNWTMFHAFQKVLANKRVLVASPFSGSIRKNFRNRANFFRDYVYPDFGLETYSTPITYAGLPEHYYPHQDWFQTVEAMKAEVEKIRFDVALLGCGSYAVPLGTHICQVMQKKAIYVGGILQLYFGIMGPRYMNPFFASRINVEYVVSAEEGAKYKNHVTISPDSRKDGFGAYF